MGCLKKNRICQTLKSNQNANLFPIVIFNLTAQPLPCVVPKQNATYYCERPPAATVPTLNRLLMPAQTLLASHNRVKRCCTAPVAWRFHHSSSITETKVFFLQTSSPLMAMLSAIKPTH